MPAVENAAPSLEAMLAALREAAQWVMQLREKGRVEILHVKADGSKLTNADIESNRILIGHFKDKGLHVVSEENTDEVNQHILSTRSAYLTADPIDITGDYINGGHRFSINLGFIENGEARKGAVYFPALKGGLLYFTGEKDGKAYRQCGGAEPEIITVRDPSRPMVIARKWGSTPFTGSYREIVSYGQHRAFLVLEGFATLCMERDFNIWDMAATHAIALRAGAKLVQPDGSPVVYDGRIKMPPYLVGHPHILAAYTHPAQTTLSVSANARH
jgi:3'(2'), 5'-bisphosphate nucleotidase